MRIVRILTNGDLDQVENLDAPFWVSQSRPILSADPGLIVQLVFCTDNPPPGATHTGKLISGPKTKIFQVLTLHKQKCNSPSSIDSHEHIKTTFKIHLDILHNHNILKISENLVKRALTKGKLRLNRKFMKRSSKLIESLVGKILFKNSK